MAEFTESRHGMWSNRWLFILAATGSAVGLGNIWKFPYITGENGGGAFVLIYLICIAVIGIPIMLAEVTIGRMGRLSPYGTMLSLGQKFGGTKYWSILGGVGAVTGITILSFYAVIGGWVLYYVFRLLLGEFNGADSEFVEGAFTSFVGSWWQVAGWFTLFMVITTSIVARGVEKGLEIAVKWTMPFLFILLLVVLVYGIFEGGFGRAVSFMFTVDFSVLKPSSILEAMGHAFFTLSLGMGAIMIYGAYVPSDVSLRGTVYIVAAADTVVALVAGLAVFSIAYAYSLDPAGGVGLLFQTTTLAFGNLPLGSFFGFLFFLTVSFATLTSAISLTEPIITWIVEATNASRARVSILIGIVVWVLGLGSVFSFNIWSDFHLVEGKTIFDFLDYLTQAWLFPVGGLLIGIFAGFFLPKSALGEQWGISEGWKLTIWTLLIGVVAPICVLIVFAGEIGVISLVAE
ncbi:MAG: sodium-dependent transporter [Gammaproteobacteria bacterium]|nr:sodium-dependent transporter [Gammaproteobacteria bacterium]